MAAGKEDNLIPCDPRVAYPMPPPPNLQPGQFSSYRAPLINEQLDEEAFWKGVGEDQEVKGFDFTEKSIRRSFIKKVYSILMCQLLVTSAFIAVFVYESNVKSFFKESPQFTLYSLIVSCVVMVVVSLMMACCETVRRTYPTNLIFLGIFTVATSLPLGILSSLYDSHLVMTAVGITAAICFALTLFAFQTRWDFTTMSGILVCSLVVLISFGILAAVSDSEIKWKVTASFGILVFSFYLVYDTQLMVGGNHKYSFSPEDYIFAALTLYLDILNILIRVLRLLR